MSLDLPDSLVRLISDKRLELANEGYVKHIKELENKIKELKTKVNCSYCVDIVYHRENIRCIDCSNISCYYCRDDWGCCYECDSYMCKNCIHECIT